MIDVQFLSYVNIVLYGVAGSFIAINLARPCQYLKYLGFIGFALAIMLHGYILYSAIDINYLQNLSMSHIISMIIWEAAIILWLAALRLPVINLFLIIAPLAILSLIFMMLFPGHTLINVQIAPKIFLHIIFAVMTFSVFTLAFIQAFLLSIQHQLLKNKQVLTVKHLFPSVEMMERLLFLLIHIGFFMLTVIIVSSFIFDSFAMLPTDIKQKVLLSMIAWVVFGIIILFRKFQGWQGLKLACWSMVAYLILLLAYFGTGLLTHW